jgi:hypothetical protein
MTGDEMTRDEMTGDEITQSASQKKFSKKIGIKIIQSKNSFLENKVVSNFFFTRLRKLLRDTTLNVP